jgi:hypothetical protein
MAQKFRVMPTLESCSPNVLAILAVFFLEDVNMHKLYHMEKYSDIVYIK